MVLKLRQRWLLVVVTVLGVGLLSSSVSGQRRGNAGRSPSRGSGYSTGQRRNSSARPSRPMWQPDAGGSSRARISTERRRGGSHHDGHPKGHQEGRGDRHRDRDQGGNAFYGAGVGVYMDGLFDYPYYGQFGQSRYDDPHLDFPRFGAYQGGGRFGYGRPYVLEPDASYSAPSSTITDVPPESPPEAPTAAAENSNAPDRSTEPIITTSPTARSYQLRAEQAFREHRYADALRQARHAVVEDEANGKLHLFVAQTLFAVGRYQQAVAAIRHASTQLDASAWGFVVENYEQFYRGNDYVTQMQSLAEHPNQTLSTHLLRGYQYQYLGYDDVARDQLMKALAKDGSDVLVARLIEQLNEPLPPPPAPPTP